MMPRNGPVRTRFPLTLRLVPRDTRLVAWSPEYVAFVQHLAACYDRRRAQPGYRREAVRLHRALRDRILPARPCRKG